MAVWNWGTECYQIFLISDRIIFQKTKNLYFKSLVYWTLEKKNQTSSRGIYRILPNIYDGVFCENGEQLKDVNYFCKSSIT